jgi:pilus assembly protein CpaE
VISVVGVTGGCGTSTVAVNCATSLATAHGSCGLVDLDLESGDLGPLLNLKPRYSVADFCRNIGHMDSAMFDQCFMRHSSGVQLIAAPLRYREIADVTPDGIRRLLRMARSRFPYVVIDQRQTYRADQSQALFHSDRIVIVLRDDFTSLRHVARTIGYFEDIGVDTRRVVYVCNRCGQPRQLSAKEMESALAAKVACRIPDAARQVNHASNKGHPVVLDYPRSGVAKSLSTLAQLLNGAVTNRN